MKYAAVLNACSKTYQTQAETLFGFINQQIPADYSGHTIIFYVDETLKNNIIRHAPIGETFLVKVDSYQPEMILQELESHFEKHPAQILLFPPDFAGAELSVRLAYRLGGSSLVGVKHIEPSEKGLVCSKDVYSNNLHGIFELTASPYCISLKNGAVDQLPVPENLSHRIFEKDASQIRPGFIKKATFIADEKSNDLNAANFILAVGQGVASKQAVQDLENIAGRLNAQMVVSRPVAMHAWASLERMVGISGMITNPDLCLTVGISGAAAFMAGIEKSSFIISINSDAQAPIIKRSDVAVIADYQAFIDALLKVLQIPQ